MKKTIFEITQDRKFAVWHSSKGDYKFRRAYFQVLCALWIAYFILTAIMSGNGLFKMNSYVHCPFTAAGGVCTNPFYLESKCPYANFTFCMRETIPAGFTHGTPPSQWVVWFPSISIVLILGAFVWNHADYNRRFGGW